MSYTIGILGPISIVAFREYISEPAEESNWPAGMGGTAVNLLSKELLDRGHTLVIFSLDPNVVEEQVLEGQNIKICIGPYRPKRRARDFFAIERDYLVRAIQRERPDVVHAHWTYEYALAAIESGIPHVITARDAPLRILCLHPIPYRIIRTLMAYSCLWKASKIVTVSPYMVKHLRRYWFYRGSIEIVPNGIPDQLFQRQPRRYKDSSDEIVFATVLNGWTYLKNGQVAIKAFSMVRRAYPCCKMIMAGVGHGAGEDAERWARAKQLNGGIEFRGKISHADVIEMLSTEVDVLVHPALEESFGNTFIEAMALGIPVIGGKFSGAVPWTLDKGKAGILVDVRSPERLSEAMKKLIEDVDVRLNWGKVGRESAISRFRMNAVADSYERIYNELLKVG